MTSIKDYLRYYIGHVRFRNRYVENGPGEWTVWSNLTPGRYGRLMEDFSVTDICIECRRLSSMTEPEMHECGNLAYDFSGDPELNKWEPSNFETLLDPIQFDWLLSRGFWLFGDEFFDKGVIIEQDKIGAA